MDSPSITARKLPSTHVIPDTPQDKPSSGNQVDLAASFQFPEDDWDDFNDFETPVKGKSSPETSGRTDKKLSNKDEELKTIHNDAECSIITATNKNACTTEPYRAKRSPEHNELREANSPDLWGPEDSVKMPQRRPKTQRIPVLSDNEEESAAVVKPFQEVEGNYYHNSCCTVDAFGQAPRLNAFHCKLCEEPVVFLLLYLQKIRLNGAMVMSRNLTMTSFLRRLSLSRRAAKTLLQTKGSFL